MSEKQYPFSKQQRLLKATDFQYVFADPIKTHSQYFTVLARRNQKDLARLGVIISKKRAKLAVTRNRVRRVVRESFRLHQQKLRGLDVVVIASAAVNRCESNGPLHENLRKHWERAAILCEES